MDNINKKFKEFAILQSSSCFNENSKANTLMSCLTSSPFTFECVKQDFGHLPNKSLLKQGKLLLLLIFLFFPVKYGSTKHWLSQVHTYMAETKKKRQTKRPQNAYLKSNYAENSLKTARQFYLLWQLISGVWRKFWELPPQPPSTSWKSIKSPSIMPHSNYSTKLQLLCSWLVLYSPAANNFLGIPSIVKW